MSGQPITEEDLHAFVDRALEPERRAEVAAYLESHPDIAARIGAFSDQRELLRAALAPVAEEPLPPALNLARLIENRQRRRSPAWRAVAAALLLALGGVGGWVARSATSATNGLAALTQEAADAYGVYAPDNLRPVELRAADSAQLVQWASDRLRRPVAVPDLAPSGYRLMGGRVVATSHGPAVMFMYDDDRGTRLVVLMRPMRSDETLPMRAEAAGDVSGLAWADGGMGYSLVGKPGDEVLRPIANAVRRQARPI